jgi:hypothetical protein
VLELSAMHRTEVFKIYNIGDHTMDACKFTIKYSSRRLKQNRAQRLHLENVRSRQLAQVAERKRTKVQVACTQPLPQ